MRDVALRVAGKNDKAVRQLELTYGGGKTHTLITLLHLMTDPEHLPRLAAVDEFSQAIGKTPPRARVAGSASTSWTWRKRWRSGDLTDRCGSSSSRERSGV